MEHPDQVLSEEEDDEEIRAGFNHGGLYPSVMRQLGLADQSGLRPHPHDNGKLSPQANQRGLIWQKDDGFSIGEMERDAIVPHVAGIVSGTAGDTNMYRGAVVFPERYGGRYYNGQYQFGDFFQNMPINVRLSDPNRDQFTGSIPGSWYCSVEDIRYIRSSSREGGYVSEATNWTDEIGSPIVLTQTPYVIGAIVRIWKQQNRVLSLENLCVRFLRSLPEDDLSDMCKQFMGVSTLREVLHVCTPRSVTIQRILRMRYDRFLITHHYISRIRAPRLHLSKFMSRIELAWIKDARFAFCSESYENGESDDEKLAEITSDDDYRYWHERSSRNKPHCCSFEACMLYYRMRNEMHLLCETCQILAVDEIRNLLSTRNRESHILNDCKCKSAILQMTIWASNRYRSQRIAQLRRNFGASRSFISGFMGAYQTPDTGEQVGIVKPLHGLYSEFGSALIREVRVRYGDEVIAMFRPVRQVTYGTPANAPARSMLGIATNTPIPIADARHLVPGRDALVREILHQRASQYNQARTYNPIQNKPRNQRHNTSRNGHRKDRR